MQECEIQIRRPWKDEWEDAQYGEEVEIANILCHQCAGLDATKMNKEDFRNLTVNCYNEIVRKVGRFAGKLPLPVFNNKEYSLFGTIGVDKNGKETVCYYADKSEKRIVYIYTELDAGISKILVSQIDNPIITTYTLGEDINEG